MNRLEPPDSLHLQAAQGWLELGNHLEADAELERITPQLRAHPMVLTVRWEIYAVAKKWEAALDIAAALIQLDPDDPLGWIHRSYALHELKRTTEARDNLLRVADNFPISATVRYNLACYNASWAGLNRPRTGSKSIRTGRREENEAGGAGRPGLGAALEEYSRSANLTYQH